LVEAQRADQRVTARATGIEEEHGEPEVLLDDVIGEADFFKSTEVNRREVRREKDAALVEGDLRGIRRWYGRQLPLRWRAMTMAMMEAWNLEVKMLARN
jgi:hypothetical protein